MTPLRTVHLVAFLGAALASHAQGDTGHGASSRSAEVHAFGAPGDPAVASRTVAVAMDDTMRFVPASIRVKQGATITLAIRNTGKLVHELVLGTRGELARHAQAMRDHAGMGHDAPYMAHVQPGETQRLTWRFSKAGTFEFACLVPGHYEAGMKGIVTVATSDAAGAPAVR